AQALRVLTSATLSQHIIPQAVDLFRIRKPGVPVSISSVGSAQLVAGLALQEADVGLLLSVLSHPALSAECLARGDMVCVVSKEAPWARRLAAGPVALSALATEPVIGLAANDPIGRLLQQACRDAGVQLQSEVTVQNYHAALAFAHRGTGMAIVDSFTALSADLDKVVVRSIAPHIPISLQAMRPRGKAPLASLPAFLDCVREASGNDHAGAAP
ncbi:MAG: LysR family transcriptional regulator, partial [Comamonadaceae bacterium]